MNLYVDLCVYHRIFDDQSQPRVAVETSLFLVILRLTAAGTVRLVSSFALEYENSKNPNTDNKRRMLDLLQQSAERVDYDPSILARAAQLEAHGIMGMDAIHFACAESAGVDFFISCDDKLIRKLSRIGNARLKVRFHNLIDFVAREVFKI